MSHESVRGGLTDGCRPERVGGAGGGAGVSPFGGRSPRSALPVHPFLPAAASHSSLTWGETQALFHPSSRGARGTHLPQPGREGDRLQDGQTDKQWPRGAT